MNGANCQNYGSKFYLYNKKKSYLSFSSTKYIVGEKIQFLWSVLVQVQMFVTDLG